MYIYQICCKFFLRTKMEKSLYMTDMIELFVTIRRKQWKLHNNIITDWYVLCNINMNAANLMLCGLLSCVDLPSSVDSQLWAAAAFAMRKDMSGVLWQSWGKVRRISGC